jgi:hypothetical protein
VYFLHLCDAELNVLGPHSSVPFRTEFDSYNEQVRGDNDPAASVSGQDPAIRASKTQSAVQKDETFQYPKVRIEYYTLGRVLTTLLEMKLYVSRNIVSFPAPSL